MGIHLRSADPSSMIPECGIVTRAWPGCIGPDNIIPSHIEQAPPNVIAHRAVENVCFPLSIANGMRRSNQHDFALRMLTRADMARCGEVAEVELAAVSVACHVRNLVANRKTRTLITDRSIPSPTAPVRPAKD